ncbi:cold-shock DNA-binding domain protein [Actinobacteria bacterium OK074]|nr:cold-shock DNA-binding domain protein [Actinobacteria bacterium OK074]
MDGKCKGIVQYFNREGGYGFIIPCGQRDPVYVRREEIEAERKVLSEGQQVSFTIELSLGRFEARNVQL